MASAGVARNTGTAAGSLGDLLGALDAAALVDDLGERWDVELGYFKRHASCSFTHPAADAVLELRDRLRDDVDEIHAIEVETHALAVGLDRTSWSERLAAMFSTPFVVAAALVHGHVDPSVSDEEARDDPAVRELAAKVTLRQAPDLDARLPHERAARVRVQTPAATFVAETPNPVGDSAHHPLTYDDVVALLRRLLSDPSTVSGLEEVVGAIPGADDVTAPLQRLAGL
jgi:2-methylcitrate dehydratase PrpD